MPACAGIQIAGTGPPAFAGVTGWPPRSVARPAPARTSEQPRSGEGSEQPFIFLSFSTITIQLLVGRSIRKGKAGGARMLRPF